MIQNSPIPSPDEYFLFFQVILDIRSYPQDYRAAGQLLDKNSTTSKNEPFLRCLQKKWLFVFKKCEAGDYSYEDMMRFILITWLLVDRHTHEYPSIVTEYQKIPWHHRNLNQCRSYASRLLWGVDHEKWMGLLRLCCNELITPRFKRVSKYGIKNQDWEIDYGPEVGTEQFASTFELSSSLGVKHEPLRKRLDRLRAISHGANIYIDHQNYGRNKPQFYYNIEIVSRILARPRKTSVKIKTQKK